MPALELPGPILFLSSDPRKIETQLAGELISFDALRGRHAAAVPR